jgi:hypothetical protein
MTYSDIRHLIDRLTLAVGDVEADHDVALAAASAATETIAGLNATLAAGNAAFDDLKMLNVETQRRLDECLAGHSPPPVPAVGLTVKPGTIWVTQQANDTANFKTWELRVRQALSDTRNAHDGPVGLSVRFPAQGNGDNPIPLCDYTKGVALAENVPLAVRPMLGQHSPDAAAIAGPHYYKAGNVPVAAPFGPIGEPNYAFLDGWYLTWITNLAEWCAANDTFLHLPWWGQDWAELNNGIEVRSLPGYSYKRWLDAHEVLLFETTAVVPSNVPCEVPLSGYGPLTSAAHDLMSDLEAIQRTGREMYWQANGWGPKSTNYMFGTPNENVERDFHAAVGLPTPSVPQGLQAIQPDAYTTAQWATMFNTAAWGKVRYVEIYTPSFQSAFVQSTTQQKVAAWRQLVNV